MTETLKQYEAQILNYRKDRNGVEDERDSLMKMVERRNFEVERLESDVKSLKQQLQSSINSKCEALSKYDEIQHKEVNIEFKVRFSIELNLIIKDFLRSFEILFQVFRISFNFPRFC